MTCKSIFLPVLLCAMFAATFLPSARADSTTYQFLDPELIGGPLLCGGCGQNLPNTFLDVQFTVPTPLAPDFSGSIDPTSWQFSTDAAIQTSGGSTTDAFFYVMTDGSGQIIGWDISGPSALVNIGTLGVPSGCSESWCNGFSPGFSAEVEEGGPCNNFAGCFWNSYSPDSTAGEFVATPEPSSLLLFGTGLFGVFGAMRKKLFG